VTPNEHANHGYSIADDIVSDVLRHLGSSKDQTDPDVRYEGLIKRAGELQLDLQEVYPELRSGTYGRPSSKVLEVLGLVNDFAVLAITRTTGLGVQTAQMVLQHDIQSARDSA
jgi:hypothetical protein